MLLQVTDNFNVNQPTWYLRANTFPFLSVPQKNDHFLSVHPTVYCETQGKPGLPYLKATLKTLFVSPLFSDYYF